MRLLVLTGSSRAVAQLFLSYASPDSVFALRLSGSLTLLGHSVWLDQWEIGVGEYLLGKIAAGIEYAEYSIVVLSQHTMGSAWVERELQMTYCEEIARGRTMILPVVIEDCTVPLFLRPRRFVDFRLGYEIGLAQLAITLHTQSGRFSMLSDDLGTTHSEQSPFPPSQYAAICYNSCMIKHAPKLTEISVEIGLPYIGRITGMWKPNEVEQNAAWELYIELVTRISVAELQPDEGLLRESLTSLYSIFTISRDILRKYGPAIARPKPGSDLSLGYLAIHLLNFALRPVLAVWHPLLLDYEHTRDPSVSPFEHERRWGRVGELRRVLNDTRLVLLDYTDILAQVADVPQLGNT